MTLLGHRKNPFKQGHPELIMVLVWVTVTCDQAFFFPSPPKQKGKKGRLIAGYAPINVNPVGGGESAGKGWGFDQGIHLLSGRFDRIPLLGGRDI